MAPDKHPAIPTRPVTVRKLVAVDIAVHGYRFIMAEFCFTIAVGAVLGLWIVHTAFSQGRTVAPILIVLGAYFLSLALNYVPLLLYAVAIARRKSARDEVAAELADKDRYMRKYGLHQLLLVVPLVMPLLAITQELRERVRPATVVRSATRTP